MRAAIAMLIASTRAMARRCPRIGATFLEVAGGCVAFNGVDSPMSRAIGIATAGPISESMVEEIEEFYRSRNCQVTITVNDITDPTLREILDRRGYQQVGHSQSWWRDLGAPIPQVTSVQVAPVTEEHCNEWARVVAAGFAETDDVRSPELGPATLDAFYAFGFSATCQAYFASIGGKHAGGGVLDVSHELAILRTSSTLPSFRGKGVQSALLSRRLSAAARAGCQFAFANTEGNGPSVHNLQKFGFQPLGNGYVFRKQFAPVFATQQASTAMALQPAR